MIGLKKRIVKSNRKPPKRVELPEPLPCPCCGGNKLRVGRGFGWVGFGVHCLNTACGLSIMRRRVIARPNESTSNPTDQATLTLEALEAWNKRTGVTP